MVITWIDNNIESTLTGWHIVNYEANDINGTRFTHRKFDSKQSAQAWIDEMTAEYECIL